ncbi:tRNA 2-selenouridine(34) synthase MnmH [Edaphobacillus lindanitolerans]|uniref:tRNA 2-selenouridine synthase n=1 Tax=Edaphobacillus lindanitolerans TaxID=550447 RepID=A0A1U7PMC5_9BACI|nr:tRNA 2-selenouridine(34) synthase MnmH [Edaphobacillus lindanitolerans]SIT84067.1 tRNA 2-selenouridine synthase [Edaphobacillus lindanitolerans]
MKRELTLDELFQLREAGNHALVDVRSPKEYGEGSMPGAINIPIFDDEERAIVGTIYKQQGQDAAKKRGLEIFSAKLPAFIDEFRKIGTPFTVYCWRGGMRSKTAATVTDLMGLRSSRLTGGIRTYRQWIVSELEKETFNPPLIVLNGYTGCGKTAILQRLSGAGFPVIDLEGLAGHRGSIFGGIGLQPSNQKKFDALLVGQMKRHADAPYVVIEGESRRIGKAVLPDFFDRKKRNGTHLFLRLPAEVRVENILDDYDPDQDPGRFLEAFERIEKRIHTPIAREIREHLENREFAPAVRLLLEYYYDPRYEHSAGLSEDDDRQIFIDAADMEDAYRKVRQTIQRLSRHTDEIEAAASDLEAQS